MLLHQAVQRGLLGLVARAVDRGAIAMRPPGLVSVGLHALGMGIWGGAASQRARACASAFGGIIYPMRHGDGPAKAGYLARERRRWPCGSGHCAMASPARSIHRYGSALSTPAQSRRPTKNAESAYPRPHDRRLSRKTRAAVGKPPGSTNVTPAVSSADSLGAICWPSGHHVNAETTAAVAIHTKLAQHQPSSIPHWLSQPG